MNSKTHRYGLMRQPTGRKSTSIVNSIDDSEFSVRNKFTRVYGRAQRSYGRINLKVDPSEFLCPNEVLRRNSAVRELQVKVERELLDLARSKKGCLVGLTLEYFENSDEVSTYVATLMSMCLTNDFILESTTKNFLLISNLVRFGESIKRIMFCSINHIHNDLHTGYKSSKHCPQLLCKYYNYKIAFSFYKFVGLLFFRFRKHLDSYGRYKVLAQPVLCGLNYLLDEGSLDSLVLFVRLVQLNFHALERWYHNPIIKLVDKVQMTRERFAVEDEAWNWLSGALDIIYEGPILYKTVYNSYIPFLGDEWTENVIYPPVQVLDPINKSIIRENLNCFHIDNNDIIRNMFVYLP